MLVPGLSSASLRNCCTLVRAGSRLPIRSAPPAGTASSRPASRMNASFLARYSKALLMVPSRPVSCQENMKALSVACNPLAEMACQLLLSSGPQTLVLWLKTQREAAIGISSSIRVQPSQQWFNEDEKQQRVSDAQKCTPPPHGKIAFLAAATRKVVPNVIALVACKTKPKYL
ncbi:hypothetical protein ABBQ32_008719 [Trebouxia sp. C0010 RCD-2024]